MLVSKTKEVTEAFQKLGLIEELDRSSKKTIRAGKNDFEYPSM